MDSQHLQNDPALEKIKTILPMREDVDIYYGYDDDLENANDHADKLIGEGVCSASQRNAIIYGLAVAAAYMRFGERMQTIGRDPDQSLWKTQKSLKQQGITGIKTLDGRSKNWADLGFIWIMALIWSSYLGKYYGDSETIKSPFMRFCEDWGKKIFPKFNPARGQYRRIREQMETKGLVKTKKRMGRF